MFSNPIIRLIIGIPLAAIVVFGVFFTIFRAERLQELTRHVDDRASSKEQLFRIVRSVESRAVADLGVRLEHITDAEAAIEFDRLFPLQADGTRRSDPSLFDGITSASNGDSCGSDTQRWMRSRP